MSSTTTIDPTLRADGATRHTLDRLVERQVQRHPDAAAVLHASGDQSYGQLWARAGQWAEALRAAGVRRGDVVGVCLRRTPDLVAAVIGVHRAGAAYVPLDPEYPSDRIAYILQDSRAGVAIGEAATVELLDGVHPVLAEQLPAATGDDDASRPAPDDLAYVIYTSGSTGRPKGVAIEHRQAAALVGWARQTYSDDELAGVLGSTSICFDLSVFEIFATLGCGGTLVLAQDALELPQLPARDRVVLVNTVPSAMRVLVTEGMLPSSVRTVNLAGEPLTRALADAVHALPFVTRLYNLYGPSEDTTYSTGELVPAQAQEEPSIGVPLPGTRAYLLDEHGAPVADGQIGELFLAGDGVARGYLHRPDLTQERFGPDPWHEGDRMYRTGDLCRRDEQGRLFFHGRTDHQVKIRGFRVELGEIEAALSRHPAVAAAVVVTRQDERAGTVLVAFVEAAAQASGAPAQPPSEDELRAQCRDSLPDYMVPTRVIVLPQLPLTPNGKVDRAALPADVDLASGAPAQGAGAAPQTAWEHLVAGAWAEVLGLAEVPVDVSFAQLGGHSLLAASVLNRLARDTGRRLGLPQFPPRATVSDLATALAGVAELDEGAPVPERGGTGSHYPTVPLQTELWVLDHLTEGRSAISVMPLLVRVEGRLDLGVLQQALDALLERHEVLRTRISDESGDLLAEIVAPYPVPLETAADETALAELARMPLDLGSGRLLAAGVLPRPDGSTHLLLRLHHAAADGWSVSVLVRDLAEVYAALAAGKAPMAPPALQFGDGARWLRDARDRHREQLVGYWRTRLTGAIADQGLPATRPPRGEQPLNRAGSRITRPLPGGFVTALRDFARSHEVTDYAVLIAASALRHQREIGATDVVVRVPVANRRHPAFEAMVGPFLDTSVARVDVSGDPTFAELVQRVAADVPHDLESSWLESSIALAPVAGARRGEAQQVSQMLVAVQNYPAADHRAGDLRWVYVNELDNGGAKTDVGCFWELDVADGPILNIEYDTYRHSREGATRLAAQLQQLVEEGIAGADRPISTLTWVDAADLATVQALNAHPVLVAEVSTPERIADQVRRTPDLVAVDCPHAGALTYAQLHARAGAVAARLRELTGGPGPEPVAVACRRGADGIAAMLGAWYAGRAYLPLDTSHPVGRLTSILTDAGAVALVADPSCPTDLQATGAAARLEMASLRAASATDPVASVDPVVPGLSDPAYLIYTSGSTGRPKGVQISHGALAGFLESMDQQVPLEQGQTIPAVTTPSFDIAGLEMWLPLRRGARIGVVDEDDVRDGFALAERLEQLAADVVQLTPSGWHLLLDAGWTGRPGLRALAGAEPVPPTLAAELLTRCAEVWNVYGPTEATIWSCVHRIRPEDTTGSSVPIGRPLANTRAYVLDHAGQLAPVGSTGFLHLGGSALADGYHGRPDLTGAAFGACSALPGSPRLYRTGDLAVLRPDGLLECLGRADNQVKVRGVRIELEEVDAALRSVPGVARAATRVQPDGPAAGQLVGYVVPEDPGLDVTRLRDALAQDLPAAMVPTAWVFLDALPLNTSGKIDRRALPEPEPATPSSGDGADGDAPVSTELSEMEAFVAEVWAEHLPVETVPVGADFFDLGGHSLTATRVVAALRAELEMDLQVRTLFRAPVLRDFASAVEAELVAQEQAGAGR